MVRKLTHPDAPAIVQLKTTMALMSINAASFVLQDTATTLEERHSAGVTLALELVSDQACDDRFDQPPMCGDGLVAEPRAVRIEN
jgi:hypothetical protein